MSQVKFQKLIDDFSATSLAEILKSHDFFRVQQNPLPVFNDKQFIDFSLLGDFDLEDNTNIVVVCTRSLTPLNERASRKTQYDLGKKILKNFQKARAGIFVYYDSKGDFRMSLIYADYVGTKVNYSTFRRFTYFVSKQQRNVTFLQQVASLKFTNFKELKELFSVEKVTKEFFKKYSDLFIEILEDFEENNEFQNIVVKTGISTTPDFVKKLMGQIVFLYFVQKKGWLGVRPNENWGTGDQGYLRSLFEICKKGNKNYFNDYLEPLFYEALAEKRGEDDFFEQLNCRIPFLNGGLFESVYDWKNTEINIHNEVLGKLLDFFDQYNFTVDENTPSDQEISVDPEMLGKIFENLLEVKDRKDKGAFYTPREIVHYMCRESLIQHLVSEETAPEERIRKLFENKDTDLSVFAEDEKRAEVIKKMSDLKDIAEKVDVSLRNVKIVDPAVGSGAFPMGMLNEISSVRYYLNTNFLHKTNVTGKELSLYDIKKETLENCIYAVDLDPGAVEIAKLRFWLALIVEFESNDPKIAPPVLPNLDYKIMQGNSLLEEYEGVKLFDEKILQSPIINAEILDPKNQHITKLQTELLQFYMKNPNWMQKGIHKDKPNEVIELETRLRDYLKQNKKIKEDSTEQKDLFTTTAESKKIWETIKSKHKLLFSESNKEEKQDLRRQIEDLNWQLIESTLEEQGKSLEIEKLKELRKSKIKPFFLWRMHFAEVFEEKGGFDIVIGNPPYVNFANLNIVDREAYKKIFTVTKNKVDLYAFFIEKGNLLLKSLGVLTYIIPHTWKATSSFSKLRELIFTNFEFRTLVELDYGTFEATVKPVVIVLQKHKKEEYNVMILNDKFELINKISIKEINKENDFVIDTVSNPNEKLLFKKIESVSISLGNICKFTRGIKTSDDSRFIKKEKESTEYKKVIRGRNVTGYCYQWNGEYIWYRPDLMKEKVGSLSHNKELFEVSEKIILQRISSGLVGTYDDEKMYTLDTCLVSDTKTLNNQYLIKYILGLINSTLLNFWYHKKFVLPTVSGYELHQLPIKKLIKIEQKPFIDLVDKILNITKTDDYIENIEKQAEVKKIEHQIDELVYKLYGLTPEEIEIVENSSKK